MSVRLRCLPGLLPLLAALPLTAAEPAPGGSRGDRLFERHVREQTRQIADACLADVTTRADWEAKRPELRRQFFEMMGLWPLPPRIELHPVVTGTVETEHFTVEKLHFQSLPGLYVTANLYLPKPRPAKPAPTVLYVCGHGPVIVDGVSYGNKVSYQHHGAWYAENGYVCLIVDTLQLGEIQGLHHGTHHLNMWWWHNLGYAPAGVECWNAVRSLDYLETRPEVDATRFGVAGRSGGGATSWWLAAADDRVKCIVPVAGIADLRAHVVEGLAPRFQTGVIPGHCDCMYFYNTYRWDFAQVAALCAPRPLLLGNSDADDIFPVPGYRRLAEMVRRIYALYGAEDRFVVLETTGPHKDTPELRQGEYGWMNRWLKHEPGAVVERDVPRLPPPRLKVLDRAPEDATNTFLHEIFVKPPSFPLPQSPEVAKSWWAGRREELLSALRDKTFRGWPEKPPPLDARPAADVTHDGLRLRAFDFTSEAGVDLRLWLLTAAAVEKPSLVVLTAVDEDGWREWLRDLGPAFQRSLQADAEPVLDAAKFAQNRRVLEANTWAFATVAPRGVGPTRPSAAPGSPADIHLRRRFALLGQTLDGQRVWDVRRALAVLRELPDLRGAPLWLQGTGVMAGVVLYAGLFEPDVARLDLWHPPASHRDGPILLNVGRVLDLPQALALAAPKQVRLYVRDEAEEHAWHWPLALQQLLGGDTLKVRRVGP